MSRLEKATPSIEVLNLKDSFVAKRHINSVKMQLSNLYNVPASLPSILLRTNLRSGGSRYRLLPLFPLSSCHLHRKSYRFGLLGFYYHARSTYNGKSYPFTMLYVCINEKNSLYGHVVYLHKLLPPKSAQTTLHLSHVFSC